MDELDDVAREAVTNLRSLEREIDAAENVLQALDQRLDEAGHETETAWQRLVATANDLREQLVPRQAQLAVADEEAHGALAGLENRLDGATRELQGALAGAEQGLRATRERLLSVDSDTLPEIAQAGSRARGLAAEIATLEDQLEALVSEATSFLSEELPNELRAFVEEIRTRSQALESYVTEEGLPCIAAESNELASRLEALQAQLRERLDRLAVATEQSVRAAVSQCLAEHNQLLADLDLGVRQSVHELEELGRHVESGEQSVLNAQRSLGAHADISQADLGRALEALREVQSYFSRQGFSGN
jgi:predicted  nucleic acid-binding Zn-ribbon protein